MVDLRKLLLSVFLMIIAIAGASVAADVNVKIKSWKVPPASHYPHDPMVAHDGSVWYAARFSNTIGRFDPKTEKYKEWVTDVADSGPHGIVEDKDGNIWFTAIDAKPTYIGKFDPKTEKFTEYLVKLPVKSDNPGEVQPASAHSLTFDPKGNIWFTLLTSDMIGRLNPKTGEMKIVRSSIRPVGPYGIQVNSKGVPFFTMMSTNMLGSIDPETLAVHLYKLPNPESRPRRLTFTPDDVVWYTDYTRGYLGRFDPKTGEASEWPTPGGAWSRPYGMIASGNVIWYSESWLDPSMIVRFDTETHEFRSWPVADCFDGMYNLVTDSDRNVWFTCHDTNRLGVVQINENRGAPGSSISSVTDAK